MGQVLQVTGGGFFIGDVTNHAHHLDRFIVGVFHHVTGFTQPANSAVGPDDPVFLVVVLAGFQASQFAGSHPFPVLGMNATAEQGVGGHHFANPEPEHAEDRVGPVQPLSVDIPIPGADPREVLAALVAFYIAFFKAGLSLGQTGKPPLILRQLPAQRALAPDHRGDQERHRCAKSCADPDEIHVGAIMAGHHCEITPMVDHALAQ
ncbi:hypothetical protein D3C73_937770 [compost metagenome]